MSNHLLVETPEANLSVTMQWINVSYATYFNWKHGRNGHLFQKRFKAILIDADEYLKHLSRYIHLNPVRAKMVSLSGALITIMYNRIAEETTRNRLLKRQIEKVKKRIFNI